ncbi:MULTISPECIES: TRAP transporter small permease [Microbacterium]|uniref:TRAP transporter small permease n=1 Tax=Microbacterium TaxID=33882 RepID=UPI00068AFE24|nr:TRAP transporter small permease subunit [Microbacterium profundi]
MTEVAPWHPEFPERRSKLYRVLVRAEITVAAALLVALFALIILQVFTRFVLNSPLIWTEELGRFVFVWFVFVGATFVTAQRRGIVVEIVQARSTGRIISLMEGFAALVGAVVNGLLCYASIELSTGRAAQLAMPATGIPYPLLYLSAALGFALLTVHSVVNGVIALRYPSQYRERHVEVEAID